MRPDTQVRSGHSVHDKARQSLLDGTGRTVQGFLDKIEQDRTQYLETEKQGQKWTEKDKTRLNRTGLRPTTTNQARH